MNAARSNKLNQATDYLNYCGPVRAKNEYKESKEFFDCVRNWSCGTRRKIGGYDSRVNVKVTDFQKESIHKLVRKGTYDSISVFVRKAINRLLDDELIIE